MLDIGNQSIDYRLLEQVELGKLREIDRREVISAVCRVRNGRIEIDDILPDWLIAGTMPVYRMRDGEPEPIPDQREITGFTEIDQRIERLTALYDEGAVIFGAFDHAILVGMSVLENRLRGAQRNRMQLSGLWVSHAYRRHGIGRRLVDLVKAVARERGAQYLYICSFSSTNTVRFYQGLGCTLTTELDPELFAKEPEDIHFDLAL